jgi:uncharacterized lipoprotein YmbA
MSVRAFGIVAALALAACTPAPRSASYFQAHAAEAAQVVRACVAGPARGAECQAAQAGIDAARDARMATFRKCF